MLPGLVPGHSALCQPFYNIHFQQHCRPLHHCTLSRIMKAQMEWLSWASGLRSGEYEDYSSVGCVTPHNSVEVYLRFGEKYRLHLQGRRGRQGKTSTIVAL
jgi:hypothetical protein